MLITLSVFCLALETVLQFSSLVQVLTLTFCVCFFVVFFQGGAPAAHPEDELARLTKKMLFDMDNPPSDEYFGKTSAVYLVFLFLF